MKNILGYGDSNTFGFTLEGGTLLACDAGRMTGTPGDPAQCTVGIGFGTTLEAGTFVELSGEGKSFVFRLAAPAATLLFSSPDLARGGTYTVSYGGDYTGDGGTWGLCSGGTYSGGTKLTAPMEGGRGNRGGFPPEDGAAPRPAPGEAPAV